jgi:hypothetical protein
MARIPASAARDAAGKLEGNYKSQFKGYTFLDDAEAGALHILLFEKPIGR